VTTNLTRIGEKARKEPDLVFTSLYHHIYDVDNLRACYDSLEAKKATGLDCQRIRAANHVSQAVFAALLGIGKTTVQQWEQGQKKPSGPAQRLLGLIDRKGLAALG
jgi:DNA-binding transcriptional regulator YiaG